MDNRDTNGGELPIGILGAGAFAGFAAGAFAAAPGVKIVAVTDIDKDAALRMGAELGLNVYDDEEAMLASENVRLVYIGTPPFLHYEQTRRALLAGKHVICEKPAALHAREARELADLARSRQLVYAVNLMQRYNPLFGQVGQIMEEDILGSFRHGFFENYASDENLGPGHWFWDAARSGGIFIEHGVHFFDLFAGWLGEGRVAAAWQWERPGAGQRIIDRVQASVQYPTGMVNFYHGFDQPRVLDRQEMRLQFLRGDLTLREWVPVGMTLRGVLQKGQLGRLQEILGEFRMIRHDRLPGGEDHVGLEYDSGLGKQVLYRQMLTAMINDQWQRIRDPGHVPVIDEQNGVRSLEMAEEATEMAGEAARMAETPPMAAQKESPPKKTTE